MCNVAQAMKSQLLLLLELSYGMLRPRPDFHDISESIRITNQGESVVSYWVPLAQGRTFSVE